MPAPRLTVTQLDTDKNPSRGMLSAIHPLRMPAGYWRDIVNGRVNRGSVKVRNGIARLTSATPGGGTATFRGGKRLVVEGTRVIVAAYLVGASVRIYRLDPDTGSWSTGVGTELTAASGKYGSTRLSDAYVDFAAVRDEAQGQTIIVATNGTDYPLWIDITNSATTRAVFHRPIDLVAPTSGNQTYVQPSAVYVQVSGASPPTYSASTSARFNIADTGSSPNNYALVSVDSTVAVNDTIKIQESAMDFRLGRQLAFLWEGSFRNFWDNVKIEISEDNFASSTIEVWDGSDITNDYRLVPVDTEGKKQIIAFPLDGIATDPNTALNAITHIRFTYVGQAPSVDVTLNIYGIFVMGNVPGLSQYAYTFYNTGSRSESNSVILPLGQGARVKDFGAPPLKDLRFPNSELLYYNYNLARMTPTQAQVDTGVDRIRFYRKDFLGLDQSGFAIYEQRFYFEQSSIVATYSGVWSFSGSNVSGTVFRTIFTSYATAATNGRIMTQFAPDARDYACMPKCYTVETLGKRLICGRVNDGTDRPSDVWISEETMPGRFSLGLRFVNDDPNSPDPFSPTRHTFYSETVVGLLRTSGPVSGPQGLLVFTDQRIWLISGVSSLELSYEEPIAKTGLIARTALHETRNAIYFLNEQYQLCQMVGRSVVPISRDTVDDKLTPATLTQSSIASMNDVVYVAYKPSGQSAYNRALVFEENEGLFTQDSPATNSEFAQFLTDGNRILYFGTDGHVWIHDLSGQATDNGTAITLTMQSGWFRPEFDKQFAVQRVGCRVTDSASSTMACTIDYHPGTGAGPSFSIGVDVTKDYASKVASQPASSTDVRGNFAGATWSAALPAGTEVLDLWLECEQRVSEVGS